MITGILQVHLMRKWGARFMLPMTIGIFSTCLCFTVGRLTHILFLCTLAFSVGLAFRFALHNHPRSLIIYIVQNLLVVLSVCTAKVLSKR